MRKHVALLTLLGGVWASANAAHPLVTDDPHTQGQNKQQIEINTDAIRHNGSRSHVGALTYSYGIHENADLVLNLPRSFSNPSGMLDASIGVKWRLYEQGPFTLAMRPELLLPTGDEERGLGNGKASAAFLVIGAYQSGPWEFLGNIGVNNPRYRLLEERSANHSLIWRASAAALYSVNDQWRVLADVGVARNDDKTLAKHPAYFLTGFIYSPTENLDLDAGIKWGMNCRTCDAQTNRQFGAGITWRY